MTETESIRMEGRFHTDTVTKYFLMGIASIAISIVFFIILFIFANSTDAIRDVGIVKLFTTPRWAPGEELFGTVPIISGTLAVTAGAMIIAVPIGVSAAIFISEVAPGRFKTILKSVSEVFAGIPSVVYGFFGLMYLVPVLRDLFPDKLLLGSSWLAGSILLGIMALPTIISVSEDALNAVPRSYREASLAMGATKWETTRKVVTPAAVSGISTAIILGMGRAIGETMAVMMVCGNTPIVPDPFYNVFSGIRPITASLAFEMSYVVVGSTYYSALFFLALVLMGMVLLVSLVSKMMVSRTRKRFGEVKEGETVLHKLASKLPVSVVNGIKNGVWALVLFTVVLIASKPWLNVLGAAVLGAAVTAFSISVALLWINKLEKEGRLGADGRPLNASEFFEMLSTKTKARIRRALGLLAIVVLIYMPVSLFYDDVTSVLSGIAVAALFVVWKRLYRKVDSMRAQKVAHTGLMLVMAVTIGILLVIIVRIFVEGLPTVTWEFLTGFPEDAGRAGGIYPAIVGTLKLVAGAMIIALPLGIISGIYLAEYSKDTPLTRTIRNCIDILSGTPSIVFGLFGMTVFVILFGWGYSLIGGCITLGFMILPVIIRTTEEALKAVPQELREGSLAMGATKWQTTVKVVLPAAFGSVITGIILAIGRAAGETAPIMFTAVVAFQSKIPKSIFDPVMALPYQLYYLSTEGIAPPGMRSGVAVVLLSLVLSMFVLASIVRYHYNKKFKW